MAGVDKTYCNSYSEYKMFKDWAENEVVTFFDGYTQKVGDWVYSLEEADFTGRYLPIMNSPTWLDTYLIQNCEVKFVLERLRDVYGEYYDTLTNTDLTAAPSGKRNSRIKVVKGSGAAPVHNKPYEEVWLLQCNNNLWYNPETRVWADPERYPTRTNTATFRSLKAVVRHLRKQYLPVGTTFGLIGRYVCEDYLIVTS